MTDYSLASLKNQKGNVLKKKFNKLLLMLYIISDTDHIYNGNVNITENENVVEVINLFKLMEFSKSSSSNEESNESINLWKLPDELVETILLNAVGSSNNAIQDYHSIMQTCYRF